MKRILICIFALAFLGFACDSDVVYSPTLCGNSVIDDGEECDDGGRKNLDGCSALCKVEEGWHCETIEGTSSCQKDKCQTGAKRCVGELQSVCEQGIWLQAAPCPEGEVCDGKINMCKKGGTPPDLAKLKDCVAEMNELSPGQSVNIACTLDRPAEQSLDLDISVKPDSSASLSPDSLNFDVGEEQKALSLTASSSLKADDSFQFKATLKNVSKTINFKIVKEGSCSEGLVRCEVINGVYDRQRCVEGQWVHDTCYKSEFCGFQAGTAGCIPYHCNDNDTACTMEGDTHVLRVCESGNYVNYPCPSDEKCVATDDTLHCEGAPMLTAIVPDKLKMRPGSIKFFRAQLNKATTDGSDISVSLAIEGPCLFVTGDKDSVKIDAGQLSAIFAVAVDNSAVIGNTCTITGKYISSKTATITVSEKECEDEETMCQYGALRRCTEKGEWGIPKFCDAGKTCPDLKNECEAIKIIAINPSTMNTRIDERYTAEVELNYPVTFPPFVVELSAGEGHAIESDFQVNISPKTLNFMGDVSRLTFDFTPRGQLSSNVSSFEIVASQTYDASNKVKLVANYDSSPGQCSSKSTRCMSYLLQNCQDGAWSKPEFCKNSEQSCGKTIGNTFACIDTTTTITPKIGTLVVGKRSPLYVSISPVPQTIKTLELQGSKSITVYHDPSKPSAPSDKLQMPAGSSKRAIAIEATTPGFTHEIKLPDDEGLPSIFSSRYCIFGEQRCTLVEVEGQLRANLERCSKPNTWESASASCMEVCSLYTSECEDQSIMAVYPTELIVREGNVDTKYMISIDLNGPKLLADSKLIVSNANGSISKELSIDRNQSSINYTIDADFLTSFGPYEQRSLSISLEDKADSKFFVTLTKLPAIVAD
ncbi:MAG: myxococcus cysteine-rich repeat containing protein [Bradymonadales bacterium]